MSLRKQDWRRALASYAALERWVYHSLERYKGELLSVLFPVFSVLVAHLAQIGASKIAKELLHNHKKMHEETHGHELRLLEMVATLSKEEFASENLGGRVEGDFVERLLHKNSCFKVWMSSTARKLLMGYLEESNATLLIRILNTNFHIERKLDGAHQTHSSLLGKRGAQTHTESRKPLFVTEAISLREAKTMEKINTGIVQWGVRRKRIRTDLKEKLEAYQKERNNLDKRDNKNRKILNEKIHLVKKEMKKPVWIGEEGTQPSLRHHYYRDLVEKCMLRITPYTKGIESEDERYCVSLGYPADHGRLAAQAATVPAAVLPSVSCFSMQSGCGDVSCATLSRDGVQCASGSGEGTIRVWRFDGGKSKLGGLKVNQGQSTLLAASSDGVEADALLVGHSMGVTSCYFLPDNSMMLSSSEDGSVLLWSLQTGTDICSFKLAQEGKHPIWHLDCCKLGTYFVTGSHDRTAALWSMERNESPLRRFVGHSADVDVVKFHPNCTLAATGSLDKTVRLWDVRTGKACRIFHGHTSGVAGLDISPNGQVSPRRHSPTTFLTAHNCGLPRVTNFCPSFLHPFPYYSLSHRVDRAGTSVFGISLQENWFNRFH